MIEESDEDMLQSHKDGDFVRKAKMLPLIFVIKARKLQQFKKLFFYIRKEEVYDYYL